MILEEEEEAVSMKLRSMNNPDEYDHIYNIIVNWHRRKIKDEDTPCIDVPTIPEVLPEVLMCQRCQEQFTEVQDYVTHKEECDKKAIKHDDPAHSDPEDMVVSEDDDDDEETGGKRLERMRRNRQDAANNNSVEENSPDDDSQRLEFPFPIPAAAPGHVTLEALQNTKVAVAQFAATAMANNADNEAALQELAVLQSTLFTLQHQQVLQLQLINQLQQQLQIDRRKEEEEATAGSPAPSDNEVENTQVESPPPAPQALPVSREPTPASLPPPMPPNIQPSPAVEPPMPEIKTPTSLPMQIQPPMCSISSSLASTIITHNDEQLLEEPNTLEMLQKRAQEVLDRPPHPPHLGFPGGPHFPPTSLPLFRPQGPPPPDILGNRLPPSPHRLLDPPPRLFPPHPLFLKREEQETPADLSKPPRSPSPTEDKVHMPEPEENKDREPMEESKPLVSTPQVTPKQENNFIENEHENEHERYSSSIAYDECSNSSKYSNEDLLEQRSPGGEPSENIQDEPENLSSRHNSITGPLSISTGQRLPANFSFGHTSSPPSRFAAPGLSPISGLPMNMRCDRDIKSEHGSMDDDDDDDDDDAMSSLDNQHMPPFSSSPSDIQNTGMPVNTIASQFSGSGLSCSAEDLCSNRTTTPPPIQNGDKSPSQSGVTSPGSAELRSSPNHTPVQIPRPPSSQQACSPAPSDNSVGALDLTPRSQPANTSPGPSTPSGTPSLFPSFGLLPSGGQSPLMTSALSSLTSSVLTSTSFSPLRLAVGPIGTLVFCLPMTPGYASSRTKKAGNMKQHMLTHKIRDMPQHMFDNKPLSMSGDDSSTPLPPSLPKIENSTSDNEQSQPLAPLPPPQVLQPPQAPPPPEKHELESQQIKREPTETELPLPKRPPKIFSGVSLESNSSQNTRRNELNEISLVQNNHNGLTGAGKYSGLLGFGYPPPEAIRSQANSPERSERPPSHEPDTRGLWDLHFERKSAADAPREDLLPPTANREGLAA
ncbi:unnamed protein product [Diabrotica balteata]|uniref:Uncharacterized protein n=1 Tax=Diabrotica balteata TaxID=107213 RepID=A0A9N9SNI0_DIABA|nr:unnamed protein product [Diabrotica balteata]